MKKLRKSLLVLVALLCIYQQPVHAESAHAEIAIAKKGLYAFPIPQIAAFFYFPGDAKGDFVEDLSVVLSDGTEWKVHPNHEEVFANWHEAESVQVLPRTSFYWFQREHKMCLYNLDREETVHVMLLSHGPFSKKVVTTVGPYATKVEQIEVWKEDEYGNRIFNGWKTRKSAYVKDIHLSDGSVWVVNRNFRKFQVGKSVTPIRGDDGELYLITGLRRHSGWTTAFLVSCF